MYIGDGANKETVKTLSLAYIGYSFLSEILIWGGCCAMNECTVTVKRVRVHGDCMLLLPQAKVVHL